MTTPTRSRDYLVALFGQRGRTAVVTGASSRPGAELAGVLLFLASPASSYVTGAVLPVDGGWSAW